MIHHIMKQTIFAAIALLTVSMASAETYRVNNTPGSGAQFTTFKEAMDKAVDGDVIIVDGSATSYGKVEINKNVTVKGPGYFLGENQATKEDNATAYFEKVTVTAAGAKLTGLRIDGDLYIKNDEIVVTRNYISNVYLDENTKCVFHQNLIEGGILGGSYSRPATYIQVTNNIMRRPNESLLLENLTNSIISRNTLISKSIGFRYLSNCVFENNIGYDLESTLQGNNNNSYSNNFDLKNMDVYGIYGGYYDHRRDNLIQAADASLTKTAGAFTGNDPYVLSGLPTGPMIKDIEMPESVVQGEDLKVKITIGTSK